MNSNTQLWQDYPVIPSATLEYAVGLDLGQAQDFTAISILEKSETLLPTRDPVTFERNKQTGRLIRFLSRMPLGTPYTEIVDHIAHLVRSPRLAGRCSLVVDATGVGRGVVDALRSARLGCHLVPVTITSGDHAHNANGMWRVPKRDLIGDLQLMLERLEIGLAEGLSVGPDFLKELRGMRVRINHTGQDTYASWREGSHDDLVFAVALAAWWMRNRRSPWGTSRLL